MSVVFVKSCPKKSIKVQIYCSNVATRCWPNCLRCLTSLINATKLRVLIIRLLRTWPNVSKTFVNVGDRNKLLPLVHMRSPSPQPAVPTPPLGAHRPSRMKAAWCAGRSPSASSRKSFTSRGARWKKLAQILGPGACSRRFIAGCGKL